MRLLFFCILFLTVPLWCMEDQATDTKDLWYCFKNAVYTYLSSGRDSMQKTVIVNLFANLPARYKRKAFNFSAKHQLPKALFLEAQNLLEENKNGHEQEDALEEFDKVVELFQQDPTHEHFLAFLLVSIETMSKYPVARIEHCIRDTIAYYAERLINYKKQVEHIQQRLAADGKYRKQQKRAEKLSKRRSWPCFVKSDNL